MKYMRIMKELNLKPNRMTYNPLLDLAVKVE